MELEVVIYGGLCVICAIMSVLSDDDNFNASIICTFAMAVFWTGNIALWTIGSFEYYVLIDAGFALGAFVLWRTTQLRWVAILSGLYIVNVILDTLLLREAIGYTAFAWMSNVVFVMQLFLASHRGWLRVCRMTVST